MMILTSKNKHHESEWKDLEIDDEKWFRALRDSHSNTALPLADQMTKLSVEERTKIMEDLHAVPSEIAEDPAMVKEKLEAFDKFIRKANHHVYQLAIATASSCSTNPNYVYVEDVNVRLGFLRAEDFDAKPAALRMLSFLEHKLSLFGKETLNRDLRLSDLSEDDMEALKSGMTQILEEPDSAGRPVVVVVPKYRKFRKIENQLRAVMYMYDTLPWDSQMKGIVTIYYNNWEQPTPPIPELVYRSIKLKNALPCRTSASHLCVQKSSLKYFSSIFRKIWYPASLRSTRARVVDHFGTHVESQYALNGFGIPVHCFPISADGTMNPKYHQNWIRDRERIENKTQVHLFEPTNSGMDFLLAEYSIGDIERIENATPIDLDGLDFVSPSHNTTSWSLDDANHLDCDFLPPSHHELGGAGQGQSTAIEYLQDTSCDGTSNTSDETSIFESGELSINHPPSLSHHFGSDQSPNPHVFTSQELGTVPHHERTNFRQSTFPPPQPLHNTVLESAMIMLNRENDGGWDLTGRSGSQNCLGLACVPTHDGSFFRNLMTAQFDGSNSSQGAKSAVNQVRGLSESQTIVPKPDDVLLGRGKTMLNHPGNIRYRKLLEEHTEHYDGAPKYFKSVISQRLVSNVLNAGSRFLKPCFVDKKSCSPCSQYWVVVDPKEAQEKVSQYFRSRRAK